LSRLVDTDHQHALFPYLLQHPRTGDGVMGVSISATRRPSGARSLSLTISERPVRPGLGRPKFPADAIQRAVRGVIMERAAACRVTDLDEAEIVLMLGIIAPVNNGLWSRGVYTSTSKEQMRARIDVYEGGSGSWYIRSVTAVLYQILLFDLRSKYETREVSGGLVLAWEGGSADLNTRQPYFTGDMVLTPVDHAGRQRALETWSRKVDEIERYNTLTQAAQANAEADAYRRRGAMQQQQQQQQALAAQQGM
jgi:hypothetical protein